MVPSYPSVRLPPPTPISTDRLLAPDTRMAGTRRSFGTQKLVITSTRQLAQYAGPGRMARYASFRRRISLASAARRSAPTALDVATRRSQEYPATRFFGKGHPHGPTRSMCGAPERWQATPRTGTPRGRARRTRPGQGREESRQPRAWECEGDRHFATGSATTDQRTERAR